MIASTAEALMTFEALVARERPNLLRFCSYLTGVPQAAEDLAQETLLTAWRRRDTITNMDGLSEWLKAIARNVCRNWQRSEARQRQHHARMHLNAGDHSDSELGLVDDFDLDIELERSELITLLDQAMALLPPETRGLLIQHYVEALPHAELATQMGLTTGTVGVRLHRGKLALRKALLTDFREDAIAYGLVNPTETVWIETRIWCWLCGKRRLHGQFEHTQCELKLRCPDCCDTTVDNDTISNSRNAALQGIKAYKPAIVRILKSVHTHYFEQGNAGLVPCQFCKQPIPIHIGSPPGERGNANTLYDWCDQCNACTTVQEWSSLALTLPQVHRFWRDHPRMAMMPTRHIEIANSPAVLTGFESVTTSAKIEVAFSQNTFELIFVTDG